MDLILPFKIGNLAESKSYLEGYRGAWFRCKVHGRRVTESGHLEFYVEYIDYPGENKEWIQVFQKNPACSKQDSSEEIMIRPSFPQWYRKGCVPEQLPNNDVLATVYETWDVGDLVDWLSEGCYWSGKITKLLSEHMVQVELPKPPIGEGKRYDANVDDLRPSLVWSLTRGWTVPLSQAKGKSWHVVRVIHRKVSEPETSESGEETSSDDGEEDDHGGCGGGKQKLQLPMSSSDVSQEAPDSAIPNPSAVTNSMSSPHAQDTIRASMAKPSSPSKSSAPSHGMQPVIVTGSQPGTRSSIKQVQGSSLSEHQVVDIPDEYLQKLDEIEGRLKSLLELSQMEWARSVAVVATYRTAIPVHDR